MISTNYESLSKFFNFSKQSTAEINKKILLEMAAKNPKREGRPQQKTRIGQRLTSYTCKSNLCFDEKFFKKIKKIAPEWFVSGAERTIRNKEILLKLAAKKNSKRPNKKTHPLGALLGAYTNPSQASYDEVFTKKIKKLAPQWFEKELEKKIIEIKKLIKNGRPKPNWKSKLGQVVSTILYRTSRTSRVSPKRYKEYQELKKLIIKKTDWSQSPKKIVEKRKNEVIKLAKKGLSKKQIKEKIGRILNDYLKPVPVNKEFLEKLQETRPEFFINRVQIANFKKQKVLMLAKRNIMPEASLIRNLYNWLQTDKTFAKEFNKINPKWYNSKAKVTKKMNEFKSKILKMANSGKKRPGGKVGQRLTNALSHDLDFLLKLRAASPSWFKPNFISFEECKKEVRKMKIKGQHEYKNNRRANWPSNPERTYKEEWVDWYDFLGKSRDIYHPVKK